MSDVQPRRHRADRMHIQQRERQIIPQQVLADRDYRARLPRSVTQTLFGDPPPGYSALDRKAK